MRRTPLCRSAWCSDQAQPFFGLRSGQQSAGIHAWTVGAIGLMTLAVMTRAGLGHTGGQLIASVPTQLVFLWRLPRRRRTRIIAAFEPSSALLYFAASAWFLAFGGFTIFSGPLLLGTGPAGVVQSDINSLRKNGSHEHSAAIAHRPLDADISQRAARARGYAYNDR